MVKLKKGEQETEQRSEELSDTLDLMLSNSWVTCIAAKSVILRGPDGVDSRLNSSFLR